MSTKVGQMSKLAPSTSGGAGKRGKRKRDEHSDDEDALERIVLGREGDVIRTLNANKNVVPDDAGSDNCSDDESFSADEELVKKAFENRNDKDLVSDDESVDEDSESDAPSVEDSDEDRKRRFSDGLKKGAWQDDDDDVDAKDVFGATSMPARGVGPDHKYKDFLESRFASFHKTPRWAIDKLPQTRDSDDSDQEDLFQTAGDMTVRSKKLSKGLIQIKKCNAMNINHKFKGIVNSVQFHRELQIGLASSNQSIKLFNIDGKDNEILESIEVKDFEIDRVRFAGDDKSLIIGSRKRAGHFYVYDMVERKTMNCPFVRGREKFALDRFAVSPDAKLIACRGINGRLHVLSGHSKEHLFELKMNENLVNLTFGPESDTIYSSGSEGRVYVWDLKTRACRSKFIDQGCKEGTSLIVSPNGQLLACGSDSGVVNVYRTSDVHNQTSPTPMKSLMNLTTEVTSLKFSSSSEMLVMSSSFKDNAIKCVHVPSMTVFSNFPTPGQNLKRVTEVDISPSGGYLAFGSNVGVAHLNRICHYADY